MGRGTLVFMGKLKPPQPGGMDESRGENEAQLHRSSAAFIASTSRHVGRTVPRLPLVRQRVEMESLLDAIQTSRSSTGGQAFESITRTNSVLYLRIDLSKLEPTAAL